MRRLAALIILLTACGGTSQTVEDYTRDNILETRAQAVSKRVAPCVVAIDRALAALDAGTRIRDAGWGQHVAATHAACDGPLGKR